MVAYSHIYNGSGTAVCTAFGHKGSKGSTWKLTCSNGKTLTATMGKRCGLNQVNQKWSWNDRFWCENRIIGSVKETWTCIFRKSKIKSKCKLVMMFFLIIVIPFFSKTEFQIDNFRLALWFAKNLLASVSWIMTSFVLEGQIQDIIKGWVIRF